MCYCKLISHPPYPIPLGYRLLPLGFRSLSLGKNEAGLTAQAPEKSRITGPPKYETGICISMSVEAEDAKKLNTPHSSIILHLSGTGTVSSASSGLRLPYSMAQSGSVDDRASCDLTPEAQPQRRLKRIQRACDKCSTLRTRCDGHTPW